VGDLRTTSFEEATILALYLVPDALKLLLPQLLKRFEKEKNFFNQENNNNKQENNSKPSFRVVTLTYPIPKLTASKIDKVNQFYLYTVVWVEDERNKKMKSLLVDYGKSEEGKWRWHQASKEESKIINPTREFLYINGIVVLWSTEWKSVSLISSGD